MPPGMPFGRRTVRPEAGLGPGRPGCHPSAPFPETRGWPSRVVPAPSPQVWGPREAPPAPPAQRLLGTRKRRRLSIPPDCAPHPRGRSGGTPASPSLLAAAASPSELGWAEERAWRPAGRWPLSGRADPSLVFTHRFLSPPTQAPASAPCGFRPGVFSLPTCACSCSF